MSNYPVLTSGQNLSIANGLSLTIDSDASLFISPTVVITNNGTVNVSGSSDQFPIFFFEECTTPITDGSQILMGLFHDIDGGLDWGVKGDECHTHSSGNLFNVHSYLGFILYLAAQCCSMMIKKRRHGPSFVGDISTPSWWPKKLSDKHRCWEALVERGPTETIHFHDRLIVLHMLVAIHLLPFVIVVHRSDASGVGIMVPGFFHLVLLAAMVVATCCAL